MSSGLYQCVLTANRSAGQTRNGLWVGLVQSVLPTVPCGRTHPRCWLIWLSVAASTVAFRLCSSLNYSPSWMVIAGGAGRPLLWMRFPRSIGSECVRIIIIKPSACWNFSRGQLRDECVGSSICHSKPIYSWKRSTSSFDPNRWWNFTASPTVGWLLLVDRKARWRLCTSEFRM